VTWPGSERAATAARRTAGRAGRLTRAQGSTAAPCTWAGATVPGAAATTVRCGVSYVDQDDACQRFGIDSGEMWAGIGAQAAGMAASGPSVWMGGFSAWAAGNLEAGRGRALAAEGTRRVLRATVASVGARARQEGPGGRCSRRWGRQACAS
jgi:hypothetical protein